MVSLPMLNNSEKAWWLSKLLWKNQKKNNAKRLIYYSISL